MKHVHLYVAAILMALFSTLGLSSCMDYDMSAYSLTDNRGEYNSFDFSTTRNDVTLTVSYAGCGVNSPVFFEVYDECPVVDDENGYGFTKIDSVKPIFSAYTDENCIYSGFVSLPAYVDKVWVYSPSFFARTLMEARVVGNTISVSDVDAITRSRAITRATDEPGFSYMTRTDAPKEYLVGKRWKEWLGSYDSNGMINYAYTGTDLVPDNSLYDVHTQIINEQKSNCPSKYRNTSDLEISEPAQVVVTFLGGNTCWNSSLGYYYYKVGQEPKSIEDANVIMLFPNTQDGQWSKISYDTERQKAGVRRMTSVKLMYYPNIANNSKDGATDVFPAGYKVGLVLATNAWSKRLDYEYQKSTKVFQENRYYRAASLNTLSVRQNGNSTELPLVASYYTKGKEFIVASFEDDYKFDDGRGHDQNFSDVVLGIGTNPVSSIADIPLFENRMNADGSGLVTLHETLEGTYLFEDLWPEKGDYDMNDACVEYTYGRKYDKWNDTYGESFSFKPRENYATKINGIAFRLIGGERSEVKSNGSESGKKIYGYQIPKDVKLFVDGKDLTSQLQYDVENQIYYVIPDTKKRPGATYTVEFDHVPEGSPKYTERDYKKYYSRVDVFLYRKEGDKTWEVHTSGMPPTPYMNMGYFNTGDDQSKPEQGIYYVRSGDFPFALFLKGQLINKMVKIFNLENEGKALDTIFPDYIKWVKSNGAECTDWYK